MKGVRRRALKVVCGNCAETFIHTASVKPPRVCAKCKSILLAPSKNRPVTRDDPMSAETLTKVEIEELRKRLRFAGEGTLARIPDTHDFLKHLRMRAERELFFFTKYIFGAKDLTEHLHKPVCEWVQDMEVSRRKLCMLPVVHLKTTICSHAFPLWSLLQPKENNLLFKGMAGVDLRILLHGETEGKAKENLKVVREHAEGNRLLKHLWPRVFWREPNKEAPAWGETMLTMQRKTIYPEPSVTALGVGSGIEQRHYDIIIIDDIACFEAALSEITMTRAKARRKALRSRLNDLTKSIELGVGTHWTANDVYVEWKKDPSVSVMIRSAIEDGKPIWPERYPLQALLDLQAEEGMGKVLFSANYMNHPLNAAFSALDWAEVRMYELKDGHIVFDKGEEDVRIAERMVAGGMFTSAHWHRRTEFTRGLPLDRLYPRQSLDNDETEEQRDLRLLARLERKLAASSEGSSDWTRLNELFAKQRAIAKERGLLN